ncbi:hypothetical protein Bbelb_426060 [Branchiostoma belcheri]|nr:hypothetical protein Bbelb_426060 [Branchiostoma belcheri]
MGAVTWTMYGCGGDLTLTVTLAPATVEEEKAPWIDTVRAGRHGGHRHKSLSLNPCESLSLSPSLNPFRMIAEIEQRSLALSHIHSPLPKYVPEHQPISRIRVPAEQPTRPTLPNTHERFKHFETFGWRSRTVADPAKRQPTHSSATVREAKFVNLEITKRAFGILRQSTTAFITINQSSTFANVLHTCGDRLHDSAAKQDT